MCICRRKSNSKRLRETRRSTQPVPTNLLEQISKHDKMEEQQQHDDTKQKGSQQETTISNNESTEHIKSTSVVISTPLSNTVQSTLTNAHPTTAEKAENISDKPLSKSGRSESIGNFLIWH